MAGDISLSRKEIIKFALSARGLMDAIESSRYEQAQAQPDRFNNDPNSAITLITSYADGAILTQLYSAQSLNPQELEELIKKAFLDEISSAYHDNNYQQQPYLQQLLNRMNPIPTEKEGIDAALTKLIQPTIDFYTTRLMDLFEEHANQSLGLDKNAPELDKAEQISRKIGTDGISRIIQDVSINVLTPRAIEMEITPSTELKGAFGRLVTAHIMKHVLPSDYHAESNENIAIFKEALAAHLEAEGISYDHERFFERIDQETSRRVNEALRTKD